MDCDRIAPWYQLIERLAFGSRLQKHRTTFLDLGYAKQHALVLGDGDGRFTQRLAERFPQLLIHSVDLSLGMLGEARKRLKHVSNVELVCADASICDFEEGRYDIVFTHFFLDCFSTPDTLVLTTKIRRALRPGADWIISEFHEQASGWRKSFTRLWLSSMYLFFRLATGLRTAKLPDYVSALANSGFELRARQSSMFGLVASEVWRRQ